MDCDLLYHNSDIDCHSESDIFKCRQSRRRPAAFASPALRAPPSFSYNRRGNTVQDSNTWGPREIWWPRTMAYTVPTVRPVQRVQGPKWDANWVWRSHSRSNLNIKPTASLQNLKACGTSWPSPTLCSLWDCSFIILILRNNPCRRSTATPDRLWLSTFLDFPRAWCVSVRKGRTKSSISFWKSHSSSKEAPHPTLLRQKVTMLIRHGAQVTYSCCSKTSSWPGSRPFEMQPFQSRDEMHPEVIGCDQCEQRTPRVPLEKAQSEAKLCQLICFAGRNNRYL